MIFASAVAAVATAVTAVQGSLIQLYDLRMSDRSPAAGELRTARLSLRRPAEADIDAIFAIHHDPGTCLHNPSDALSRPDEAEALYRDGGAGSGAFL